MALYVNTSVSSLNAQRMMPNSTNALDTSYKRLASGLRINSAKDDAAGLRFPIVLRPRLTVLIRGIAMLRTVFPSLRLPRAPWRK